MEVTCALLARQALHFQYLYVSGKVFKPVKTQFLNWVFFCIMMPTI